MSGNGDFKNSGGTAASGAALIGQNYPDRSASRPLSADLNPGRSASTPINVDLDTARILQKARATLERSGRLLEQWRNDPHAEERARAVAEWERDFAERRAADEKLRLARAAAARDIEPRPREIEERPPHIRFRTRTS